MKKLTFIIVVVLFVSCGNKKAAIVEQIKSYKDSIGVIERTTIGLTLEDSKKYEEIFYLNGEPDRSKVLSNEFRKQYNDYHATIEDKKWELKVKQSTFQNKIDSLKLELKKY